MGGGKGEQKKACNATTENPFDLCPQLSPYLPRFFGSKPAKGESCPHRLTTHRNIPATWQDKTDAPMAKPCQSEPLTACVAFHEQ